MDQFNIIKLDKIKTVVKCKYILLNHMNSFNNNQDRKVI